MSENDCPNRALNPFALIESVSFAFRFGGTLFRVTRSETKSTRANGTRFKWASATTERKGSKGLLIRFKNNEEDPR